MSKWVLITGASSGIGKALAYEFAGQGFNLLLTARSQQILTSIAEDISSKFNIQTDILPADLADENSTDALIESISGKQIDVLVNNAGFGVKGDFAGTDLDEELKMLNVQLTAMLKLTKAILPQMLTRKSSKILNVASVYSFAPVPKQSVYSACKAFMLSFSSALQNEVKDSGVTVSVLCPGITQTEFRLRAGIEDKKNSGMTSEEVAKIAFRQTMKGKNIIVPGFQNKVFVLIVKLLPNSAISGLVRIINNIRGVNQK